MGQFADNFKVDDELTELGDSAVFTKVGGQPTTIQVLFDDHYQLLSYEHGDQVITETVIALCKRSDVDGVGTKGDTLAIGGKTYFVARPEQHGDMTRLILTEDNVNE